MEGGTVLRVRRASPLLLAIALAAGCGGSSGGGQRLTREQYAAKADAICSKYKQKTDALARPATLSDLADVSDQVLPLLHGARGELRALRPPQSEEATANAWVDEFDVIIDDVEKIHDAAKKNDAEAVQAAARPALRHDQHANDLATQLGMTVCNKD
jgi:protein-tyrosine-phosphatase